MKVESTEIDGVLLVTPKLHDDERGFFMEIFHESQYQELGIIGPWTQDNLSRSARGVLRGMHFQFPNAQGKLVTAIRGQAYDVVIDIRRKSPTFGHWISVTLDDISHQQIWIPPGCAHGFLALVDGTEVYYKCSLHPWIPANDRVLCWNDPDIGIDWPFAPTQMNDRDRSAPRLTELEMILSDKGNDF